MAQNMLYFGNLCGHLNRMCLLLFFHGSLRNSVRWYWLIMLFRFSTSLLIFCLLGFFFFNSLLKRRFCINNIRWQEVVYFLFQYFLVLLHEFHSLFTSVYNCYVFLTTETFHFYQMTVFILLNIFFSEI